MDYKKLMDDRQRHVHEHFPASSPLHSEDMVRRMMDWRTFWLRNPGRFAARYFNLSLHLYQHIILWLANYYPSICIIAARASAKSFVIAVFALTQAVLRPGSKIVIASSTKKQARLIVTEKIQKEILPRSDMLNAEISYIRSNGNDTEVAFHNGSTIMVVVGNDHARGHRATILIYEEFRMIAKSVIDTVLSPFLIARQAPFFDLPEYAALVEEPKEIYISSSWYRSHWMWGLIKLLCNDMVQKDNSVVLAMDYSISLRHKIKTRRFIARERKKLDAAAWAIEYENQMLAENANAYFTYEMLAKNQTLKRPFYPRRAVDIGSSRRGQNKYALPKQPGELRLVSCDIAMEGGAGNDNSIFACIRLLPETVQYKAATVDGEHIEMKRGYRRQLVYMEPQTQFETTTQAIRIKQLFADFDADYCVLDARNAGVSIYDMLSKVLWDEERGVEYPPWCSMNDERLSEKRVVIAGQKPVVYSIKAQLETNSAIAECMRRTLMDGMMDLLISHQEGIDEIVSYIPEYAAAEVDEQLFFERPYLETSAMINEMIALEYTRMPNTNLIRITEKGSARKDRYTAVSYGNYFADLLEKDLFSNNGDYDYVPMVD